MKPVPAVFCLPIQCPLSYGCDLADYKVPTCFLVVDNMPSTINSELAGYKLPAGE